MSTDARLIEALDASVCRARRSSLYAQRLHDARVHGIEDLRKLPLTTRADLQRAGPHGTRAAPIEEVCHYGETSGTSGASNSTWLTAADFDRNARAIAARHPDVFAPGRVILNRFPFMAAPAHLIQLVARRSGGVAIPAGNINWDVPFPRALELAQRTGAQVLAGFPLEPVVLAQLARTRDPDPRQAAAFDTFFLGGAALPPALRDRIARVWNARVIELYGSTETMLLGTGCAEGQLHLETELAHCEVLSPDGGGPVEVGEEGRLVVTTLALEGSPLVRYDTGDRVRRLPPCPCGDARPAIVVLGRQEEVVRLGGRRLHAYELIDAAAAAADALDSSVFFTVVLPDRLLVRIESDGTPEPARRELDARLGPIPVEVELVEPDELLDTELLSRSPSVYKPVLVSDWGGGRQLLSVTEGMIEWPRPTPGELWRWLRRTVRRRTRAGRLRRKRALASRSDS